MSFEKSLFRHADDERTPFSEASAITATLLDVTIGRDRDRLTDGSFSDVYSGTLNGRKVAVKRMRYASDDTAQKTKERTDMFWKETAILMRLSHTNILPFMGLCYYEDAHCFVTPWIEHSSILNYVKKTPSANIHQIISQLVSALVYLHEGIKGTCIVHGDLHEKNVMIDRSNKAILCDFGLSKIVPENHQASNSYNGFGDRSGVFLAPELLLPTPGTIPARRSKETDVFAFGGLVFAAYNRGPAYQNNLMAGIAMLSGQRPARPAGAKDLSNAMWQLIEECWAQDAQARPAMASVKARLPGCAPK